MSELRKILIEFDVCKLSWCCWKGLHKIPLAFDGLADIDLYVPMRECEKPEKILMENDWFELQPAISFEGISHWYKWDKKAKSFFHIHLYRVMRTGVTYSKSFVLDDTAILSSLERDCHGVWVPSNEVSQSLHFLRINLKSRGVLAKLFFIRESDKHKKEFEYLASVEGIDLEGSLRIFKPKEVYAHSFALNGIRIAKRLLQKIRLSNKRLIPAGVLVSLVGSDGSGKSTLIPKLQNALDKVVNNVNYSFGRPKFNAITIPFWLLRNALPYARVVFGKGKIQKTRNVGEPNKTSFLEACYHIGLAYERKIVMKKALKAKSYGFVVLMDRCPTMQLNQMDGPKIIGSGVFISCLAEYEKSLYQKLPKVDLAIRLELNLEDAVKRNEKRIKAFKESEQGIENRFYKFQSYQPNASKEICIDATASKQQVFNDVVSEINRFICHVKRQD
jgi:thymidylate kinase